MIKTDPHLNSQTMHSKNHTHGTLSQKSLKFKVLLEQASGFEQ